MGKYSVKSAPVKKGKFAVKSKVSPKKQVSAQNVSKKIKKSKISVKKNSSSPLKSKVNIGKKTSAKNIQPAKPAKVLKPKKQPSKPSGPKGYTPDENVKFKAFKIKFQKQSNQGLKDILRKNLQSMSGNKDQLVYKCADGATLGRIPRCPKCFGGRPKFDHQKGTYYCSGYRDDVDFKNCHSSFTKEELKRDAWEE